MSDPGTGTRSDARLLWSGAALLTVLCVATLGLAATGRLTLYIHPRYVTLSVVTGVVGLLLATLGLVVVACERQDHEHGHDQHKHDQHEHDQHEHDDQAYASAATAARPAERLQSVGRAALVAVVAVVVLVVPPTTLSAALRSDRRLVTTGRALGDAPAEPLVGADTSSYTVRDWAALAQQGPDAVAGQPVSVVGYVLDRGEGDVFWVARLTVSCCAVDAQPVGVAVHRPGWRRELETDAWVSVRGTFVDAGDLPASAQHSVVVEPTEVTTVPEPKDPYVF
ncbi:TIGR03943 family protein [Microlunatus sagamiharensis]|uniref:TIGR03943 family protein n=1 Tax=Microlunatus sagamiharensis TaxID=546874 RepID=A0A1H2LXK0_9ACTN|nr:TIGR03943 family protein [Microlunatus sagamiharensis]SDU85707.1 TIGR03943 family protein [Microlunatus sagamiharensis]